MIPIKIECACGQPYAFDTEPVNGQMPSAVACPTCGADGTTAANEIIARQFVPAAAVSSSDSPSLRLSAPAHAVQAAGSGSSAAAPTRRPDPRLGLVDRDQAQHEARAKVMWGDPQEQVVSYLMIQGFSHSEALEVTQGLIRERTSAVRGNGIRKIIIGAGLMCVPVIALVIFLVIGVVPIKLMAVMLMIGLYGLWLVINGILMAVAPKSEKGDVADQ